jgi:16S rRNA (guanine527-N7)-methyltransferase
VDSFDASVISARAFAPLDRLLQLACRFSRPDTLWLLPKGRNAAKELEEVRRDWKPMFHVEHSLTDRDAGILTGRVEGRRR